MSNTGFVLHFVILLEQLIFFKQWQHWHAYVEKGRAHRNGFNGSRVGNSNIKVKSKMNIFIDEVWGGTVVEC